jgi:hypothetical protein
MDFVFTGAAHRAVCRAGENKKRFSKSDSLLSTGHLYEVTESLFNEALISPAIK